MIVYLLNHARDLGNEISDRKTIGIFDSKTNAEDAVCFLKTQPGFQEYPNDFYIDAYEMNCIEWKNGFKHLNGQDKKVIK